MVAAVALLAAGAYALVSAFGIRPARDPAWRHCVPGRLVCSRFAGEVIEHDQIVREDEPQKTGEAATQADEEIKNLVAIPKYVQDEFSGVIVCASKDGGFSEYDEDVLLSLGNQARAVLTNGRPQGRLRSSLSEARRVFRQGSGQPRIEGDYRAAR